MTVHDTSVQARTITVETLLMRRFTLLLLLVTLPLRAADAAAPLGDPILDPPTLRCLGVYWIVGGDANADATVALDYRPRGSADWRRALPLFRVERGKHVPEKYPPSLDLPGNATLYAGSILSLEPHTAYDLRLTLSDPDGRPIEKTLTARTRAEPVAPANAPVRHVVPGAGGGSGTADDPFRGLAAAQAAARPGDVFLLRPGTYAGPFDVTRSGEPGKPIVWRGVDTPTVTLDAQGDAPKRPSRAITASGAHDVYFENLTIRNADYGLVIHDAARIVVRRCHIHGVDYGITGTRNTKGHSRDHFIADNLIEGPSTWPRTKGIENARGVQVTGAGHVVCYNRIRNFADAVDTFNSPRCESIDVHNNEISECTDDGIELDYARRNVRCFDNRLTNVFQGVSVQPVFGGPAYVVRNAMYNVVREPFKIHNGPSGVLFLHNTVVKRGAPMLVQTPEPASNLFGRNNLFVGTTAPYAWENSPKMIGCDFDYDGFAGGPFPMFLKWNGRRYRTLAEARAQSPVERHATLLDSAGLFASGARPPDDEDAVYPPADLRPAAGAPGLFGAQPLAGVSGPRPALGAYALGEPLPHYGPRPRK
jgi:hypothetical protein